MVTSIANQIAVALSDNLTCPLNEVVDKVSEILNHYSIMELKETLPSTGDGTTTMYLIGKFKEQKIAQGMKVGTYKHYEDAVISLCQTMNKEVNLMTSDDIIRYLDIYRFRGNQGKGVSDTTVQNRYLLLSSFYNFMLDHKYIAENPMKIVPTPKAKAKIKIPLTDQEVERLYMACEELKGEDKLRAFALIEFALETGARVEELANFNISDIDFVNLTCLVRQGKGKKDRIVIFGDSSFVRVREYLSKRADSPLEHLAVDTPLFTSIRGERCRLSEDGIRKCVGKIGEIANVSRVHPHLLRTTCATNLIKKGVPINVVAEQLGHDSIETTTLYTRVDIDTRKIMIQSAM